MNGFYIIIKFETKCDPILQALTETIVPGWPETVKELPVTTRHYLSFRDELSEEDGVILK